MQSTEEGRGYTISVIILVMFLLTAWMVATDRSEVASAPSPEPAATTDLFTEGLLSEISQLSGDNIYAKYEGVDGEVVDETFEGWIRVLSMEWGVDYGSGSIIGPVRRAGSPVIEDLVLTFDYEKAVPKLVDKLLKRIVTPTLEIEFTTAFDDRVTYLRYELKNVLVTDYEIVGMAGQGRPTVAFAHNFEEIKVTYSEYDDLGNFKGHIEYEYKREQSE